MFSLKLLLEHTHNLYDICWIAGVDLKSAVLVLGLHVFLNKLIFIFVTEQSHLFANDYSMF